MVADNGLTGGCVICRPATIHHKFGQTIGLTLMSDLHIGATGVDYGAISREIANAIAAGDRIAINGDVFDLILPRDHKRYDPRALHQRISGRADVINAAIEWAVELLAPAAHLIDMIGVGNHETAVETHHSVDVVSMLIDRLRPHHPAEHTIHHGGITGFIDYRFRRGAGNSGHSYRYVIWYHHGTGGGAPVTRGTIDFARKEWASADLRWMGHKHYRVAFPTMSLHCPTSGDEPVLRETRCVMTGAYFRTYSGQTQASIRREGRHANYASEKGLSPQPVGGARVLLTLGDDVQVKVIQ
jgi:hypothetical protein